MGVSGYKTPTPTSHNPARLLRPQRGTVAEASKGQAMIARAQQSAGVDAEFEDLALSRHERRVIMSEAREHARLRAKRAAVKAKRASKKAAKGLVEL
jgi:hypothetical protein